MSAMKARILLILVLFAALALPGRAQRAENAQAVLRSTTMTAGAAMESASATQNVSLGDLASPGDSAVDIASFFGGFLIPALDSGGLLTAQRLVNYLIGRDRSLDPLAADFFGNGDGRLDVADTVTYINHEPSNK